MTIINTNLSANDLNSKDPRRIERGYNFKTPLTEISLGLEFNMLEFNLHEYSNLFTPYFYTGFIHSKYDKQILQNGNINRISKKNTTLGIPLVVGIKYRFFENFIISFEVDEFPIVLKSSPNTFALSVNELILLPFYLIFVS